jgi:uncharacterized membrane protein YedE/YeeE
MGVRMARVIPFIHLAFGIAFGVVLASSGTADYDTMQRMFLFEELRLFGMAIVTTAVAAIGLHILRRSSIAAQIRFQERPVHKGTILGAIVFGMGWGVSGTCPGTALAQLGLGHFVALATIAGIFTGQLVFGVVNERVWRIDPDSCT